MSAKNKNTSLVATDRDFLIFKFLWKWKAVSTRAIAKKFFPQANPYSAYIRLTRLHNAGFIEAVQVEDKGMEVWALAKRGYLKIKPRMVELEIDGYKSENYHHDFIATAFHLGEWLIDQPKSAHTFSEQQLRRIPEDNWPDWIPRSDLHRPDGYSRFAQGEQNFTVAFEAELSAKGQRKYEKTVAYYDSQSSVNLVLWLVSSKGIYSSIARAFEKHNVREWHKHHFILLSDFRQKGWGARFIDGQFKGQCIDSVLSYNDATNLLQNRYASCVCELLDSHKRPVYSKASSKS